MNTRSNITKSWNQQHSCDSDDSEFEEQKSLNLKFLKRSQIEILENNIQSPISPPKWKPNSYTQVEERVIKVVTGACKAICGNKERDGFIKQRKEENANECQ